MVTASRRAVFAVALLVSASAFGAKISDISNTKHNLSASGPGTVKATSESQICVFCHTPHKANAAAQAPLWNRALSTSSTYTLYTSESMDATLVQPEGSSKLCLSCHDGTMALGNVGVLNGQENATITLSGTDAGATMPNGNGTTTGFTRDLGTNLSNDHPISFTYDTALAGSDGELLDPADAVVGSHIGNRDTEGPRHPIPLENNKLQCVACHDPHIRDVDLAKNAKFLRLNRFQESPAVSQGSFNSTNDQICLGCHKKEGWSGSAHANDLVANEVYKDAAATQREFPTGIAVWQAACLNCHDTHTVQGAKRLLREGTDSLASPKAGGNPAQEQTCYQCHAAIADAQQVLDSTLSPSYEVPDIKSDFTTAGNRAMPIATPEVHAVTDGDLSESPALLNTRHAECTDCHNPHRVVKNTRFDGTGATNAGTHEHTHTARHTNAASGVLKGMWGVDMTAPVSSIAWGTSPSLAVVDGVSKEYQVCLKCHSSYAYGALPPSFTDTVNDPNGTPDGANCFGSGTAACLTGSATTYTLYDKYTDQGMEFQAPTNDRGEKANGSVGVNANHRSWHPVFDSTGRTATVRKQNNGSAMDHRNFLDPWNDSSGTNIGNQTMYCSDCHGSTTTGAGTVNGIVVTNGGGTSTPDGGKPWGPHGSSSNFILKGSWNNETGVGDSASGICFKCHSWNQYANNGNTAPQASGFSGTTAGAGAGCNVLQNANTNMHIGHARRLGQPLECTWCHVAVPHGWKNKQLLIDISTAGGSTCAGVEPCVEAPYILEGYLGGNNTAVNWRVSGEWTSADCGGQAWMAGNANGCNAPQ